ncbi:MAG: hypothetical protein AB1611_22095 [bacterium]
MRKRREKSGIVLVIVLLAAALSAPAFAIQGMVTGMVRVNTGKLLLITAEGKKIFCEKGEKDLPLTPQARIISLEGTSVIEVENAQLILDKGDEMAYESETNREFRCLSGSIEAVSGQRTRKVGRGEVIALSILPVNVGSQGITASGARLRERVEGRLSGLVVNPSQSAPNSYLPYQGGPYIINLPWNASYGQQSPWAWASPYW